MKRRFKNFFGGLAPIHFEDDPNNPGGGGGDNTPPPADDTPPPADDATPWYTELSDTWRDDVANGIDAENAEPYKNTMSRYNSLPDAMKALHESQAKIRAGLASSGLPENATEEQLKDYREANGIPATVEDYDLQLSDGLEMTEADTAVMGTVNAVAHKHNISSAVLSELTSAMLSGRAAQIEQRETQDNLDASATTEMLKNQWGGDYQVNQNMVKAFTAGLPEELRTVFEDARGPDGKALMNHPELLDYLAQAQRKINPMATVIDDTTGGGLKTIVDEIKALEARMGTEEWYADDAAQQRYMQLVAARDAVKQ